MLHSLENEGAVKAYWTDADSGKRRKYYSITKGGKTLLDSRKEEWNLYKKAVDTVLGGI